MPPTARSGHWIFNKKMGSCKGGGGCELGGEEDTPSSGGVLTSSSVDSVGVEGNILDNEADTSHVFVSQSTFFGGPLESGLPGVLDFVHELALLVTSTSKFAPVVSGPKHQIFLASLGSHPKSFGESCSGS